METAAEKIGLIAGAGPLPHAVIKAARAQNMEIYVASLTGFSKAEQFTGVPVKQFRLGELGGLLKTFRAEAVKRVCFAGIVSRPDFSTVRPDLGAVKYLPGVIKAAKGGDDALLSHLGSIFEDQGMRLIGAQDICAALVMPEGVLGQHKPCAEQWPDIDKARYIAKSIGALDIGQGAVVRDGLVLAVEAQDGTDGMLERVSLLPSDIRGQAGGSGAIMAKMIKPGQEERIDLPTFGVTTVKGAIKAGLSGIVVEAGGAFVMNRDEVVRLADEAGIFIIGLERQPYAAGEVDLADSPPS